MSSSHSPDGFRLFGKKLYSVLVGGCFAVSVIYAGYQIGLLRYTLRTNAPITQMVGEIIPDTPAIRSDATHTLIIAIKSTCPFCAESVPFYRTLIRDRQLLRSQSPRFVAVCFEAERPCREYLTRHHLTMDDVMVAQAVKGLRILGTPTLLLVDAHGRVKAAWSGFQGQAEQESIRLLVSKAARDG